MFPYNEILKVFKINAVNFEIIAVSQLCIKFLLLSYHFKGLTE